MLGIVEAAPGQATLRRIGQEVDSFEDCRNDPTFSWGVLSKLEEAKTHLKRAIQLCRRQDKRMTLLYQAKRFLGGLFLNKFKEFSSGLERMLRTLDRKIREVKRMVALAKAQPATA